MSAFSYILFIVLTLYVISATASYLWMIKYYDEFSQYLQKNGKKPNRIKYFVSFSGFFYFGYYTVMLVNIRYRQRIALGMMLGLIAAFALSLIIATSV